MSAAAEASGVPTESRPMWGGGHKIHRMEVDLAAVEEEKETGGVNRDREGACKACGGGWGGGGLAGDRRGDAEVGPDSLLRGGTECP